MKLRWLYKALLSTRPTPLAIALKRLCRVKRTTVKSGRGSLFWVDPVSHFGMELMETLQYEPVLSQLLETLLRPGDTFIDVGANEGYFTVLASKLVAEGQVYAIEPQSRLRPVLEQNLRLNGITNSHLFQLAFSDSEGEIELHLTPSTNTGGASATKHWKFGAGVERVRAVTLDQFVKQCGIGKIRLVKLDCEGAEFPVLSGAQGLLARHQIEFLSVEYHPTIAGEQAPCRIDGCLRQCGYSLTQAGTGIWVYHLPGLEKALAPLGAYRDVPPLAAA